MKKISIIVPVYNAEQYLKKCLDSLVEQTLSDIEIICVNDASTDNSINILRKYKSEYAQKIIIIDSPVNLKQGGARNLGVAKAKGEYISFVDSDDWVDTSMYEKLYDYVEINNPDMVQCDYYEYHGKEKPLTQNAIFSKYYEELPQSELHKQLILNQSIICGSIIKKDIITDNAIVFPEKIAYEDCAVCFACYINSIVKIDEPLYYYRCDNISTTRTRNNPSIFNRLDIAKIMKKKYQVQGFYESYSEEIDFRFINMFYMSSILLFLERFDSFPKEKFYEMRDYIKKNLPEYRKNKYFLKIAMRNKIPTLLNDISPFLVLFYYKAFLKYALQFRTFLKEKSKL